MRLRWLTLGLWLVVASGVVCAQISGDVIGIHDLGPGSKSPLTGARPDFCNYCHAPHSGQNMGLWNQTLSVQTYSMYTSDTEKNRGTQPMLGSDSNLCLSCHDGTVAPGTTTAYGKVTTIGSMYSSDVFGSNMMPSHPFSMALPLKDAPDLASTLVSQGKTLDPTGAVKLINGNVQCGSCHEAHVQAKDLINQNFLVRDSSSGQMCLACHDPTRQVSGQINPIADWSASAHAISTDKIAPQANVGAYTTVAADSCSSCHSMHNSGSPARLLRGQNEQDCVACHSGGSNISPAAPNVFSEYTSPKIGHPFPSATNLHDAAEPALLNNNRHATCVDCHNGHASQQVTTFPPPPNIRVSQKDVAGISANDGISVIYPSVNQYDNCLRCHGTSSGKQTKMTYGYTPIRESTASDPLNVIPQFALTASSSHPVTHIMSNALPQPSLLANMLNENGITQGRGMGNQIFCTDCHNSDDNREFGGGGPNGPHGSKWTHILERRYEFSQTPIPGQLITNLYPNPDLSVNGPYAMCGKCHDLTNQIMKNTSWTQHSTHLYSGFSCSVCHTAHGVGGTNPNLSGQRLIDFDVNVVAPNGGLPVSYNRNTNTCALICHGVAHNSNGSVSAIGAIQGPKR